MLVTLWNSFFSICCFKKAPEDLPASRELLVLSLAGYSIGSFLLAISSQSADVAALSGIIDAGLLATITYLLLTLFRLPERWLQTTSALFGTGIIFSLFALPFSHMLASTADTDPFFLVLLLVIISLLLWNISVMAHIMRHALSSSFALGVFMALIYVWVITAAITTMFPPQNLS
jgi:hypothetical protein